MSARRVTIFIEDASDERIDVLTEAFADALVERGYGASDDDSPMRSLITCHAFEWPTTEDGFERFDALSSQFALIPYGLTPPADVAPTPPDVAQEMPDPNVPLCGHCVEAYRNGIEPGETACECRARGELVDTPHIPFSEPEPLDYADPPDMRDEHDPTL
jgi:hypothetical protein